MTDLNKTFAKNTLAVFLMAGDGGMDKTAEYISAVQECGADMIQVGIPFSDPVAETAEMQSASARALGCGADADKIFRMLESIEKKVPFVIVTYANPAYRYGYEKFFARCAEAGVSAVMFNDIPFEESAALKEIALRSRVEIIDTVAYSSGHIMAPICKKRIEKIASSSRGFLNLCAAAGDMAEAFALIRKYTSIPVCAQTGDISCERAAAAAHACGAAAVNLAVQGENLKAQILKAVQAVHSL